MILFPFTLETLIAVSVLAGLILTLIMALKLKHMNPNLYYNNRIYKETTQKVLNFNLLYTMVGWGFAFGSVAFAIGNMTIFILYDKWILGDASGKFFIIMAITAGILFYCQKSYFFVKDNAI